VKLPTFGTGNTSAAVVPTLSASSAVATALEALGLTTARYCVVLWEDGPAALQCVSAAGNAELVTVLRQMADAMERERPRQEGGTDRE
jgi:hypothetical protein